MDICQFHSHSEEPCNQLQIINLECADNRDVVNVYEETSNCELRFISEEEMNDLIPPLGEYEELTTVKQLTTSCNNYCKLYKTFVDTSINNRLENTDDQLLIEIIKEDINESLNPDENKSILDSISFNIEDHEENIVKIKITNAENGYSIKDSPKFVNLKSPELISKSPKKERKERSPRKPLQLANYCDLITDAINSSPEKRMILTEIYDYIMEHVPFFKEIDQKGKEGWKNCVRHTLSVNKKFIRIKNTSKCRFSYWTVCEGGDFETQFAQYSWVSEIYKPEERKRSVIKRKPLKLEQNSKDVSKPKTQVLSNEVLEKKVIDKKCSTKSVKSEPVKSDRINRNKTTKPVKHKIIEQRKPVVIKTKTKNVKVKKTNNVIKKLKREVSPAKKIEPHKTTKIKVTKKKRGRPCKNHVVTRKAITESIKKKQPTRTLRVLPERLSRKAENFSVDSENDIRRSSRRKSVRKSWKP